MEEIGGSNNHDDVNEAWNADRSGGAAGEHEDW
jgi:hypothetical protein